MFSVSATEEIRQTLFSESPVSTGGESEASVQHAAEDGRALTRIYDLTLHSRSRATSTFYEDLANLLFYGVPNRDKARLTTIILSHFHRNHLDFDSILVFSNQSEIPRMDLARLSRSSSPRPPT